MDFTPSMLIILAILGPIILAFGAKSLAGIISQNHWPDSVNEGIADGFILFAVIGDGVLVSLGNPAFGIILAVPSSVLTAYLAQNLGSLKRWSLFLQGNFLAVKGNQIELDNPVSGATLFPISSVPPTEPKAITLPDKIVPPQITLPTRQPSTDTKSANEQQ